ncbi:cbb3-type cytochrome oxidase assembly protein CcoS [Rhizobium oryzicola]|uniref:Cbb3-type cytochrome oxidase assembly protein CcoS n=1 Tax=Rhizobium oryzicola TaxID=1232668 RepID=A0ABT8SZR4_9HYPH|nr:cbb3-type cytochrome oxidase assembly protein CcoS [Rhizobium oryzicola]MDO1583388.1 cbb3-type cytochrome oxidase assembly protein CcoS [Rhizobium oryzicola]
MVDALFLVPLAVILSAAALIAFLWSLADGQYEDLAGAAERVLHEDRERPASDREL